MATVTNAGTTKVYQRIRCLTKQLNDLRNAHDSLYQNFLRAAGEALKSALQGFEELLDKVDKTDRSLLFLV